MKRLNYAFSLMAFWMLLWHSNAFSVYEELISVIHENAKKSVPNGPSDNIVALTFIDSKTTSSKTTLYFDEAIIKTAKIVDDDDVALKILEDIHPLTLIFYIIIWQKVEISFERAENWGELKREDRIRIITGIYDFMRKIGINKKIDDHNENLPKRVREYIVKFLSEELGGLNDRELNTLMRDEIITLDTYNFLSPEIADKMYQNNIDTKAHKLANDVAQNLPTYRKKLTAQIRRGKDRSEAYEVVATNSFKFHETTAVHEKTVSFFNNDAEYHNDAFSLAMEQANACSYQSCCRCWCCLFCLPCMFPICCADNNDYDGSCCIVEVEKDDDCDCFYFYKDDDRELRIRFSEEDK